MRVSQLTAVILLLLFLKIPETESLLFRGAPRVVNRRPSVAAAAGAWRGAPIRQGPLPLGRPPPLNMNNQLQHSMGRGGSVKIKDPYHVSAFNNPHNNQARTQANNYLTKAERGLMKKALQTERRFAPRIDKVNREYFNKYESAANAYKNNLDKIAQKRATNEAKIQGWEAQRSVTTGVDNIRSLNSKITEANRRINNLDNLKVKMKQPMDDYLLNANNQRQTQLQTLYSKQRRSWGVHRHRKNYMKEQKRFTPDIHPQNWPVHAPIGSAPQWTKTPRALPRVKGPPQDFSNGPNFPTVTGKHPLPATKPDFPAAAKHGEIPVMGALPGGIVRNGAVEGARAGAAMSAGAGLVGGGPMGGVVGGLAGGIAGGALGATAAIGRHHGVAVPRYYSLRQQQDKGVQQS